jgi:hypothetical protein
MHDDPGRLVDGEKIVILIEDVERDPLRLRPFALGDFGDADLQLIAGLHSPRRPRRRIAVDQHAAALDPVLNTIAGNRLLFAQMAQQDAVDPQAMIAAIELDRPPFTHALSVFFVR